jgi:hypothetical protein
MILNMPFEKLGGLSLALSAVLFLAEMKCQATLARQQGEQQSQSQQPPPPPPPPSPTPPPSSQPASEQAPLIEQLPLKRRKVWTNDDVVTLRSPADNYVAEKEAQEAADAQAAAKEAAIRAAIKSEKPEPRDIKLPATPEETEKILKSAQDDIQEETVVLDKLHKELLDAPKEQREGKQKEIDHLTASIEVLRREAQALQDHLQTLRRNVPEKNPPASPEPPSL